MILSGEMVTIEFYVFSVISFLVFGIFVGYRSGLEGKKVLDYEKQLDAEEPR